MRFDFFGFAGAAGEIDAQIRNRGHMLKRRGLLLPIQEVPRRDNIFLITSGQALLPKHDDPVRARVGKRSQEDAVDHAEDRGVRSNPEAEGDHRGKCEAWLLEKGPHPVADVLEKSFQREPSPAGAHFLLHLFDAAHFHHRGTARFLFVHAFLHFFLR